MGLDMYLYKKSYIGNEYRKPEEKLNIKPGKKEDENIEAERITYIIERVGYWRKANQIHKWFVDKVQGGIDECQESPVDKEQLKELLKLVDEVLADTDKAPSLLPAQHGFFFGDESYDSWYFDNLKETKRILDKIIKEEGKSWSSQYFYQSSW